MNIRFDCPGCEQALARIDIPGPAEWQCPRCDHLVRLPEPKTVESLSACAVCGTAELYKKKDFPHWLGMSILTGACVAFLVVNAYRYPYVAWAILLGSALFDGALYLCVRDVTVCYGCGAQYRGFAAGAAQKPYDLGIAERYRQERIRRERMAAERRK